MRNLTVAVSILVLVGCSSDRPTRPASNTTNKDARGLFSNLTMRDIAKPHNLALQQLGELVIPRLDRHAPLAAQLDTIKTVATRYLRDVVGSPNASVQVENAINAEIWREGPQGRFWEFRSGTPLGLQRAPTVEGSPLSAAAQVFEDSIVTLSNNPSDASIADVRSALYALEVSAVQTLGSDESSDIVGFAELTDSSIVYWSAQIDSAVAGLDPLYGSYFINQEVPVARPWAASMGTRGLWRRLWNAVAGDAWGSITGAWACVMNLVCVAGAPWGTIAYNAAVGGALGSLAGALME